MFDPQYKNLNCIWDLVGKELTKIVVYECDKKIMISLLMKVNHFFNPDGGSNNSQLVIFLQVLFLLLLCWWKC
jgi:hypothetical protein